MDSHSLSYEIVELVLAQIPNENIPRLVHIDPLALEVQQILDREIVTRINQDDNDW